MNSSGSSNVIQLSVAYNFAENQIQVHLNYDQLTTSKLLKSKHKINKI